LRDGHSVLKDYAPIAKQPSLAETIPFPPFPFFHSPSPVLQAEHGAKLVGLVLGLLAVRRGGLSTDALLDAVSACDDVMGAKGLVDTVMQHTGVLRESSL